MNYNTYPAYSGLPAQDQLAQLRQPYQYPFAQVPQFQPQGSQYQQSNLIWVRDEMEARSYPVGPNCSVTMRNENLSELYIKKADATGCPEFEVYSLVKRQTAPKQPENPEDRFVTYKELKALLASAGAKEEAENV